MVSGKYEKLCTKETTSKTVTVALFSKISNRKQISNEQLHHFEPNIFLEKVTESINSETNKNFPGNDGLTAEFYKHFSN